MNNNFFNTVKYSYFIIFLIYKKILNKSMFALKLNLK